ncbi:hypothetical protein C8F01DRAFT_1088602 [Mycena amicta]|nr:hypothetical protein C8F01DRAFT_1088602 [Mycena amicta]
MALRRSTRNTKSEARSPLRNPTENTDAGTGPSTTVSLAPAVPPPSSFAATTKKKTSSKNNLALVLEDIEESPLRPESRLVSPASPARSLPLDPALPARTHSLSPRTRSPSPPLDLRPVPQLGRNHAFSQDRVAGPQALPRFDFAQMQMTGRHDDSETDPPYPLVRRDEAIADLEYNAQYGVRNTHRERYIGDEEMERDDFQDYLAQAVPEPDLLPGGKSKPRRKRTPPRKRTHAAHKSAPAPPALPADDDHGHEDEDEDDHAPSAQTGGRKGQKSCPSAVGEEAPPSPFPTPSDAEESEDEGDSTRKRKSKSGRPPLAVVEEIQEIQQRYEDALEAASLKHGYSVRNLTISSGVIARVSRDTHNWNGFQHDFRVKHPKTEDMTTAQWRDACRKAYYAKIEELGDERDDPEARQALFQPYIDAYHVTCLDAADNTREKKFGSVSLMQKAIRPMVTQSQSLARTQNLLVMGLCADLSQVDNLNKNVLLWGGGTIYDEAKSRHPTELNNAMNSVYSVIKMTQDEMRLEAFGEKHQRNLVELEPRKPGEARRDVYRRHIIAITLNQIYLAIRLRDNTPFVELRNLTKGKVPWKGWADFSTQKQLRIINWPVDFKAKFPGGGFVPNNVANKKKKKQKKAQSDEDDGSDTEADNEDEDQDASSGVSETEALKKMCEAMTRAYRLYEGEEDLYDSEENVTAPSVESWTPDEIALDDPSNVPLVVCADGAVLLRPTASEKFVKELDKRKAKRKAKGKGKTTAKAKAKGKGKADSTSNTESTSVDTTSGARPKPSACFTDPTSVFAKPTAAAKRPVPTRAPTADNGNIAGPSSGPAKRPLPTGSDNDKDDEDDEDDHPSKRAKVDNYTMIRGLRCRFFNKHGAVSTPFAAEGIAPYDVTEEDPDAVNLHRYTEFFLKKEWKRLEGFKPVMTRSQFTIAEVVTGDIVFDFN